MTRTVATRPLAAPQRDALDRGWFLQDSSWSDTVWILAPGSKLEEERPVRLRWDFSLPSGGCLTDSRHVGLLEASRRLFAVIRTRSLKMARAQRPTTVRGYFGFFRDLLCWMDREGLSRFADLDEQAIVQFLQALKASKGLARVPIKPKTVQQYLHLLLYLYRFKEEIGDGLLRHPFPGQTPYHAAGTHESQRGSWPYTPDEVAIPFVQGAIEFLSTSAIDILRARELYSTATHAARQRYSSVKARDSAAMRALRTLDFTGAVLGFHRLGPIASLRDFVDRVSMLYAACFAVISYLVGPRVSEIVQLQAGCVRPLAASDSSTGAAQAPTSAVMVGSIFKWEADYHGRRHEWVVPQPVIHAVTILEALSAPHRLRTGRHDIWLRADKTMGATEWQIDFPGSVRLPDTLGIRLLLNRFGARLALPQHRGKPWIFSTHQGRKTFARFAALRDRSALFALSQHLGHRDRTITDHGYAGTDYRLDREIAAEVIEQSAAAWEQMLAAPALAGRAGAEIVTKRPHFRGERMKQEIKAYARMLVETGLTLGICEWGFCVYREEHSACLGNASGPNPVRREPSTCARCRNFAVSVRHRPYWVDQVKRYEALLNEPALPTQTLKIARQRLTEALEIVRSIDRTVTRKDDETR